jgi:hypothetical protein
MPREVDGYSIYVVRNSYYAWITQRMGAARDLVIDQAPLPPELARHYRRQTGPRVRVVNTEFGGEIFGYHSSIDEWCLYQAGQSSCQWLARRAVVREGVATEFLDANFDVFRAIAYLREHGIEPEDVMSLGASAFGLADPLSDPLAHIDIDQATDRECVQVQQAIDMAEQQRRRIVVSAEHDERAVPRPPPPHAYLAQVTLPLWYARLHGENSPQSYAEVTLSGRGDHRVSGVIEAIMAPLRSCPQLN